MKRTLVLIGIVTVVTGLLAGSAYAQDGKYAGEFLNIGVGARALAMGGAFIGVANDGTAAYWNPAGMGALNKKEVTAMYCPANILESVAADTLGVAQLGASYSFYGLVWKLGSMRVGGSYLSLSIDDIYDRGLSYDDANTNGQWDAGEKVFYDQAHLDANKGTDMESAMILSFSQNFSAGLSVGANVKLLSQSVFEYSASGFGVDVGIMYRMNPGNPLMGEGPGSGLAVGVVAKDVIGTTLNWSTDSTSDHYIGSGEHASVAAPEASTIPLGVGAGVSYTLAGMPGISAITVAADVTYNTGWASMDLSAGMEMWIANMLAIRAGVKQLAGPTSDLNTFNGSAGIGLKVADMVEANYAFTGLFSFGPQAENMLGGSHRISLAFRF
jgi:hypothetical protein